MLRACLGDLCRVAREKILFQLLWPRQSCAVHRHLGNGLDLNENTSHISYERPRLVDEILRPDNCLFEFLDVLFNTENTPEPSSDHAAECASNRGKARCHKCATRLKKRFACSA